MKLTLLFFAICLLSVSCTSQPKFTSETVLADSIVGQPGIDGAAGKNGINCWEALFRDINEDGVIDDTEKLWDEDGDGFADADVNQDGDVNFLDCLGRPGEDGRDGLNGLNGTNGINGAQGPQGPAGPAGPQGPSGPQGPQGLKGDPGDQGPIGLTGPTGSRGLGCNVSTLPPSSQYPAGGAQINCEDNSSAIVTNGSNAPQEWKLVASGSNYTEGARYTMTAAGLITTKLMHPFGNQHVSTTVLNWPNSSVTQLRFLVRNLGDEFCVGGNGVLQLTPSDPAPSYANCTNYAYTADSNGVPILNASARSHGTWTRLSINGNPRNKCTNSMQNSPVSGYPGMYGYANYWAVECLYSGGASGGDWQNAITSLIVEEADYSPGVAVWQWEIWAR